MTYLDYIYTCLGVFAHIHIYTYRAHKCTYHTTHIHIHAYCENHPLNLIPHYNMVLCLKNRIMISKYLTVRYVEILAGITPN